jgi:hypothetical protein
MVRPGAGVRSGAVLAPVALDLPGPSRRVVIEPLRMPNVTPPPAPEPAPREPEPAPSEQPREPVKT